MEKKFITVLNRHQPLTTQLNALAHISLCLGTMVTPEELSWSEFIDESGTSVSRLSDYPYIILSTKKNGHLKAFHENLLQESLPVNTFFVDHINGMVQEQLVKIQQSSLNDLVYVAVGTFGTINQLDALTGKFQLYRNPS